MQRSLYSTLHIPNTWFEPHFCYQPKMKYEITTDSCIFNFACHEILVNSDDQIILYGELLEIDNIQNYGWRLLFINKIEKTGAMHVLKDSIPTEKFSDPMFMALLSSLLAIGTLPSELK